MLSLKEIKTFLEIQRSESICNNIHNTLKNKITQNPVEQISKKPFQFKIIILIILLVTISLSLLVSYVSDSWFLDKQNYNSSTSLKTKYTIENLKGDSIATWKSWKVPEGTALTVNIVSADDFSQDKINAIKDAILSEKSINIDDSLLHKGPAGSLSTYYLGWQRALEKASEHKTELYIPTKFSIIKPSHGEGDITITLSNLQDADGYSGYTKSITDENQILKSSITIYNVNELTTAQLTAITRHEFGHALGLAHSTAPEDLMYVNIQTDYPYISGCDVGAVTALYNGEGSSQVMCEK